MAKSVRSNCTSVAEVVTDLISNVDDESKRTLREITCEKDLYQFHHGFGTFIRNNYGLWQSNKLLLDDCRLIAAQRKKTLTPLDKDCKDSIHPDDASHIIITMLWETLREETI